MARRPEFVPSLAILAVSLLSGAAANSIDDVVNIVRDGLAQNRTDPQIARSLHRLNLQFKLDNRTAEELESLAPGPKSIAELERLREVSRHLPLPAVLPAFPSPPDPGPAELRNVIAQAQRKALNYTVSLPDFICTETIRRFESPTGVGDWSGKDSLTVQLTYFDHDENYKLTALNGRATGLAYEDVGGALSKGEFGSMLLSVFSPNSRATFKWLNWTTLRKRTAYVFAFQIEARNSNYVLRVGRYGSGEVSAVAGQHGLVYIDRETSDVLRLDCDADSIPADFPLKAATRVLDYGMADVGGQPHLLPLHADIRMFPVDHWPVTRNEVEFTRFRKFTGESTISFGDPSEGKSTSNTIVKK